MRSRVNKSCIFCVLMVFFCPAAIAVGRVIYVDADASGANDGSSWANAYKYLQDAIGSAESGDEIRVAQGIYKPDQGAGITPGDREATFRLKDGVAIKGGYAGFGQPDPNTRDIKRYETILSGDLNGDDGPNFSNYSENSYCVVYGRHPPVCPTAVLDGFTVRGANGTVGGGMYVTDATIKNCSIVENYVDSYGGGVASVGGGGGGQFVACTIRNNVAGLLGGGVYIYSSPKFINCLIVNNKAGEDGGGIYNRYSFPEILNCTISGNKADSGTGGGLCLSGGMTEIKNSILWDNTAGAEGQEIALLAPDVCTTTRLKVANSCIRGGQAEIYGDLGGVSWGDGIIEVAPLFVDANSGDYHLKSQGGRWDENDGRWMIDDVTSPCIDAGDLCTPIGHEPFPNGGRINMGAYGGTAEASKSYFGKPVCETIVAGDINGDCKVDFADLAIMASHWLKEDIPVNSNSVVKDGIEYYLETDRPFYRVGEKVLIMLKFTNVSEDYVDLKCGYYPDGCWVLLVITDETDNIIWVNFRCPPPGGGGTINLGPSQSSAEYREVWNIMHDNGTDRREDDFFVGPGSYKITADACTSFGSYKKVPVSVLIKVEP